MPAKSVMNIGAEEPPMKKTKTEEAYRPSSPSYSVTLPSTDAEILEDMLEDIIEKRQAIRVDEEEAYANFLNNWAQLPTKEIAFEVTSMINDIEDMYEVDDDSSERESLTFLKCCYQVGLLDALVLPEVKDLIKAEEDRDLSAIVVFLETL